MEAILQFAYMTFLGMPMIAWLGIITYILLFFTILLQVLKIKKKIKFSFKAHKTMAYITLVLATVHGLLVMFTYL
ncbi:MAG: hypothetical protein ACOC34_06005 [Thermotogota bacterium]